MRGSKTDFERAVLSVRQAVVFLSKTCGCYTECKCGICLALQALSRHIVGRWKPNHVVATFQCPRCWRAPTAPGQETLGVETLMKSLLAFSPLSSSFSFPLVPNASLLSSPGLARSICRWNTPYNGTSFWRTSVGTTRPSTMTWSKRGYSGREQTPSEEASKYERLGSFFVPPTPSFGDHYETE